MEDRHNENCKHVALYICQKHIWLYVTSTLFFKTVPSVCACNIKADWCIGSDSQGVKLCQWSKGNHQRLFSIHYTAGWRDLQGLIVHQLEAADILCLCSDCFVYCGLPSFPPKWHALTPDRGNLKVQQRSLGTHTTQTHTYTNHRSTQKSTRDPDLLYPSRNKLLAGICGKKET